MDQVQVARLSPSSFARYCMRGAYSLPPHIALLERKLVMLAARRLLRLAVSVPPRHGKSLMCSKFFPAWYLGTFPNRRVILVSYEADFAAQWGRAVRDLLIEHGQTVFGVSVRHDSNAANRWDIAGHEGGMQTAGAGGPIMGKGADLIIVDDPHKNWDEVFHETIREKIWDLFQSSTRTRLEPMGAIAILQQRWHEQDLLGHVLELNEKGIEKWDHFDFPALAESNDILGRKPGEALWPERYDAAALNAHRVTVHSKFWEAQYQQHPSPLEGGLFKVAHANRYRIEGDDYVFSDGTLCGVNDMQRFLTVDTATSKKTSADHTAIAAWGLEPRGRLVLLDLDLRRIEGPEIMRAVVAMSERWKCVAWIEENATSKHLLSFMEAEGLLFRTLSPGSIDKWTRAQPAAARWERGMFSIPESTERFQRNFLAAFERQVYRFSAETDGDDDVVDVMSYAARVVLEELTAGTDTISLMAGMPSSRSRDPLPSGYALRKPSS